MELAPAPVTFSDGVLVLQSPPRGPPGAEDAQAPDELEPVDVVLEDLQATARRPTAQAIAPKRSPNGNLRRKPSVGSSVAGCLKGCSSHRLDPTDPGVAG